MPNKERRSCRCIIVITRDFVAASIFLIKFSRWLCIIFCLICGQRNIVRVKYKKNTQKKSYSGTISPAAIFLKRRKFKPFEHKIVWEKKKAEWIYSIFMGSPLGFFSSLIFGSLTSRTPFLYWVLAPFTLTFAGSSSSL